MAKTFVAVILSALLVGCMGSTRVISTYSSDDYTGTVKKVLVLNPGLYVNYSELSRDMIVEELRGRGMEIATREDVFRTSRSLSKEEAQEILLKTDVDGVLLITPGHIDAQSRGRPTLTGVRGALGDFEDEVGYALSLRTVPPVYRAESMTVDLIANLYLVESAEVIWMTVIRTENPGSTIDAIEKVASKLAKEVANSGRVEH